jgi:hypothetical protein
MRLFIFFYTKIVFSSIIPETPLVKIDDQVCYDSLGCFDNEFPFDCLHSQQLPGDPKEMKFQYRRYTSTSNYELLEYG